MKIVFDGRWLGRTGIGRYAEELLDQLQKLDTVNEYVVLLLPKQYESWKPVAANFRAVRTTYEVYTWQEQLLLPWQIRSLAPDLVHFMSFNLPIFYAGRFVVTIHDLTLVRFKNVKGTGFKRVLYEVKYWAMRGILRVVTSRAERIFVPTEFGRDDVVRQYKTDVSKIVVTPEAVHPSFAKPAEIDRFVVPERFIMYLGNYYPYKNIDRLIEAFSKTKARRDGVKLLLAGFSLYFTDLTKAYASKLNMGEAVVITGSVTDGELANLYQKTELYVFPSLYEGFGLPGLEAMSQGAPVLAARASCLPEVYGSAVEYFDPLDTDDMARQIDVLLDNPKRREELSRAGYELLKRYSWKTMAKQTLRVYKDVAD